ncbi:MAG: hypothetical protein ACYTEQ_01665 [Planctomycetota bacterium]|jgi:hypothetical protein
MEWEENRCAYFVLETQKQDGEYMALIAKENRKGFYKTDWLWGADMDVAEQCAADKNKAMGLTEAEAARIVCSTM